ncbi:MAG TPA: thiamine pyrophosphate-binding protein [Desulfosporosinus sp.]|nr:thiamine pyrophosphate-binding protein [Desulfosporosinus sp.]
MAEINGGRLFAKALKNEGVDTIFTLVGGHIMTLMYGCREEGIKVIDVRHEMAGGYAADAFARVSGKPAVLVTTAGPGITNTVTAMAEALFQGVPLIHIGGGSPLIENETGPLQDMNTLEIMGTVSKWSRKIYDTARIPEYVAMAFRYAMAGTPGPVYLECPMNIMSQCMVEESTVKFPVNYRTTAQAFGDQALIDQAADLLVNAERPVLVIGDTARFSTQYGEAIPELVDYLKMPVMCQTLARGLFADEANPMFKIGGGALPYADVVLNLCVNFDYRVAKGQAPLFPANAKLIQAHPDSAKVGYNTRADIGIIGGAGAVAKQILAAVKAKKAKQESLNWVQRAGELAQKANTPFQIGFSSEGTPMQPGRCAFEVSKFLAGEGKDWTVVCDGGDASQWIKAAASAHRPGQIVNYGPLGTIGTGPGFSLGAWAANKKPVLYYTGDGSFGFYPMEFDTFVKQGVPVVCVISNDSAWGMIKLSESLIRPKEFGKGAVGCELAFMYPYEKLAALWDGYGVVVTKPEDIVPAIKRAVQSGKPAIINVQVDQVSMSPATASFAGVKKA